MCYNYRSENDYCHFHEVKVLIAEIQIILTLTLTLTPTKINSQSTEKRKEKLNKRKRITMFRTRDQWHSSPIHYHYANNPIQSRSHSFNCIYTINDIDC